MKKYILSIFFSIFVLVNSPEQGHAGQEEPGLTMLYGDGDSISLATGSSKPIHLAPSIATVITAEQIRAMGATTLDEALETVPGLHVSRSYNRFNAIYSIRGLHTAENPQVLMLYNGFPITSMPSGSRPSTFRMPVAGISRIEVIRGPGSALYGSDAFAGVINIITKDAEEIDGTRLGLRSGSFDSQEAWLLQSAHWGSWDLALQLEWQKGDGDSGRRISSDQQSQLDTLLGTQASLAPGHFNTAYNVSNANLRLSRKHWTIGLWNWQQRGGGTGPGIAQALDPAGHTDMDAYLLDIEHRTEDVIEHWDFRTRGNVYYKNESNRYHILPSGTVLPIGSDGNVDRINPVGMVLFPEGLIGTPSGSELVKALDFTALYSGIAQHRIQVSTGYKTHRLDTQERKNFGPGVIDGSIAIIDGSLTDVSDTPYIFLTDRRRINRYLSLQDEWAFASDWELTAGLRYDHYSDCGDSINPRLALVWASTHNLTTKLLYGRAFRSPSLSELYFINNPSLLGNPDLNPEIIDTLELSFDYRLGYDIHTALNLFTYKSRDMINLLQDPATLANTSENTNDQHGHGFELEAQWQALPELQLSGNFSWQNAENDLTGASIPDTPGQQLTLASLWKPYPGWSLHTQVHWIGDRKRTAMDPRPPLDDDTLVHLTLRRENIARHWEFAMSVRNLFDHDAYEPSNGNIADDYPLEGRSVYAELRYSR